MNLSQTVSISTTSCRAVHLRPSLPLETEQASTLTPKHWQTWQSRPSGSYTQSFGIHSLLLHLLSVSETLLRKLSFHSQLALVVSVRPDLPRSPERSTDPEGVTRSAPHQVQVEKRIIYISSTRSINIETLCWKITLLDEELEQNKLIVTTLIDAIHHEILSTFLHDQTAVIMG